MFNQNRTRAMRIIESNTANITRQIKSITQANRAHAQAVESVVADVAEIRRIAERNAGGVKETRDGTADLLRNAQSLTTIVTRIVKPH